MSNGIRDEDDDSFSKPVGRLSVFYYAVGHMLNDITSACWFTYLLLFLTDIGLSPRYKPYLATIFTTFLLNCLSICVNLYLLFICFCSHQMYVAFCWKLRYLSVQVILSLILIVLLELNFLHFSLCAHDGSQIL